MWFKTTEIYSFQLWSTEVKIQRVSRAVLPLKARGEDPFLPLLASSGFQRLPAILGVPSLVDISLQSLPPMSHGLLPCAYLCLYRSAPLFIKTLVTDYLN